MSFPFSTRAPEGALRLSARAPEGALRPRTISHESAKKPANLRIKARRIDFAFEPDLARYWYDDDAFLTHFMHALSITFPDGERMFMDAVRAVQDRVHDEETRADIAGFMGQEALHSRAHEALNEFIASRGYPALALAAGMRAEIAERKPEHTKKSALALTCALEHITAIMGVARPRRDRAQGRRLRRVPRGLRRRAHAQDLALDQHARADGYRVALSGRAAQA
jgi:predicted metal-dependent hydrolase